MNFLDPQLTNDGKPYGPERYKVISRERYFISKNANISYGDTGEMSPTERKYILQFIIDDLDKTRAMLEKSSNETKNYKMPVFNSKYFPK